MKKLIPPALVVLIGFLGAVALLAALFGRVPMIPHRPMLYGTLGFLLLGTATIGAFLLHVYESARYTAGTHKP